MVSYKELGLVNTRDMFAKAIKGGYAIPAFNFNNMEQLQAIISAAVETKSPVILQVSSGARKYANQTLLRYMAQGAVEYAKELGCPNPQIALHLDHGDSLELCKSCIEMGFSSVMIDGSHLPYDENVALTRSVVEYAHQFDVTVEGELGVLAGIEDDVVAEHHTYTEPEEVVDFVSKTGVDSLAISIGTSHGANKFTPEQCHRDANGILVPPPLRFDILAEIGHSEARPPLVVGFAAETGTDDEILAYGADKASRKGADFICLNRVGESVGFGDVPNDIRLLDARGTVAGRYVGSKDEVAAGLVGHMASFLDNLKR